MRIGFSGWAGSGKTEASQYIVNKYKFKKLSFADGIKLISREIFNSKDKNRKLLQDIGEKMRDIDPMVWVNHVVNRLDYLHDFTVDDLRRLNEFEALVKHGFIIVRIVCDEDIRVKRLIDRDGFCDKTILYNESENGCKDLDLIEIHNNGDIKDFHSHIDKLVLKELGL